MRKNHHMKKHKLQKPRLQARHLSGAGKSSYTGSKKTAFAPAPMAPVSGGDAPAFGPPMGGGAFNTGPGM